MFVARKKKEATGHNRIGIRRMKKRKQTKIKTCQCSRTKTLEFVMVKTIKKSPKNNKILKIKRIQALSLLFVSFQFKIKCLHQFSVHLFDTTSIPKIHSICKDIFSIVKILTEHNVHTINI